MSAQQPRKPAKATTSAGVGPSEAVVTPTTIATPSEQVASSVTVITGEELQRTQQRTVADALRTVPGMQVVQTGGPGGVTSVFTRGTNSNHTKVLIDGIEVGDPSTPSGAPDLAHLMTADVERIEVLRGPQSGLYGANAIGGVISIITKQGKGPLKASGYVEGGSFGTFNQAASASGSQGPLSYAFNVSHLRTGNSHVTPGEFVGPGQTIKDDFYENMTYSTKLGYDVSKSLSFNMVARYTDSTLKFTEGFGPLNDDRSVSDNHQFFIRGESVVTLFGGAFKNYFGVTHSDQRREDQTIEAFNRPLYDGEMNKYDWRGVVTLAPGQVLVMGAETRTDKLFAAASNNAFFSAVSAEQSNRAGYIELQSQLAKRVFLVSNIRYDDNDDFGGVTTWRVAPAYIVPGTETKLKASVGTGFKAPSLFEMYGQNFNPDLQPEESIGFDVGFEQPLLNDKVRFGVTYFQNKIKNLIVTDFSGGGPVYPNINVNRSETSGFEAFAAFAVSPSLSLRTDYTYTDVDVLKGPVSLLLRRPQHKATATATWTPTDQLSLTGTVLFVGDRFDADRFSGATTPVTSYTLVNLAADYKLNKTTTLFGRVDNLFDEQYQDPLGWERPGLGVFAGVRLTTP